MKKILLSALAIAVLLLAPVTRSRAEDAADGMKPVIVVSFSGYDALFQDLDFVGQVSDNPDLGKGLEGLIAMFTQWQGLNGLDKSRPWGVAAGMDAQNNPQILGFLPVTDLKKLSGALAGVIGEPDDLGEGVFRVTTNGGQAYIKEKNGWAFISQMQEHLEKLPKDPVALLDGLNKQYDIAVRVHVQNIPQVFRDMGLEKLKEGAEAAANQRQEDESDEQFESRVKVLKQQINRTIELVSSLENLTLGWSIDGSGRRAFLDLSMTAMAGSEAAKSLANAPTEATRFAGFQPAGALFKLHVNSKASEDDIENGVGAVESLRVHLNSEIDDDDSDLEDDEKPVVKKLVGQALDVLVSTLKKGVVNGGLAVVGEGPFTVVGGAYVAGGDKLDAVFKKAVKLREGEDDAPKVKLDVEEYQGVHFHSVSAPWPDDAKDDAKEMFGEKIHLTAGFGPESVYLAFGPNGVKSIKAAIDRSTGTKSEAELPLAMSIALAPILKIASQQDDADPNLAMLAKALKENGKDEIQLTASPITNGVLIRLEAQEGVLKILGIGAKMAAARGGAGGL